MSTSSDLVGADPTPGPVTRPYHHGALADAMVEQALAAVREHGAERVSLRAIAQRLAVSPSAAYNHFADKEALLVAVGDRAVALLDERMERALASHSRDTDDGVRGRFADLGRAYIGFAVDEPHLFRLAFGSICAVAHPTPEWSGPYVKLNAALDDLDRRGLLAPGVRTGLDVTTWGAAHGIASLILDGLLPPESGEVFLASFAQLAMRTSSPEVAGKTSSR